MENPYEKIPNKQNNSQEAEKKKQEGEQNPEQILKLLGQAIENNLMASLSILDNDDKILQENIIRPEYFDKDVQGNFQWIYVKAEDGSNFPIEISRIKKIELLP